MYWLFVYVYRYNFSQTTIVKSQPKFSDFLEKQECIPVGCVPSAAAAVCWDGGVCLGGVCLPRGVSTQTGVSQHALRQTRPGQNSWHTLLKILPCRNFVADGKNRTDWTPHRLLLVFFLFNNICAQLRTIPLFTFPF